MSTHAKRYLQGALFLTALFLMVPAYAWDMGCSHSAERRASVDSTGASRVIVISRAGDLEVQPAQGTVIQGTGKACASSEDYLRELQLVTRRDGTVIFVEAGAPSETVGFGMVYAYLDLTVAVPAGLPVEIRDSSGDIEARDEQVVQVQDSSGDIVIDGAREVVIPSDSSGDITIDHVAGDVRIDRDSSGDIRIADVGRNVQLLSDTSGEV